jgi:hypothetical protein
MPRDFTRIAFKWPALPPRFNVPPFASIHNSPALNVVGSHQYIPLATVATNIKEPYIVDVCRLCS